MDYTNIKWAPVINCVVRYEDKFLIIKRSDKVSFYSGYWSGVSGFLDDKKSLKQKVLEELKEELNISENEIKEIKLFGIFDQEDFKYKKAWISHSILVEMKTDAVKLNWESKEHKWLELEDMKKVKSSPGFKEILRKMLQTSNRKQPITYRKI